MQTAENLLIGVGNEVLNVAFAPHELFKALPFHTVRQASLSYITIKGAAAYVQHLAGGIFADIWRRDFLQKIDNLHLLGL